LHTEEEARMNPDWVGISTSRWIDPSVPFKYLNHSCDPSGGIRGSVGLYALKKLRIGDEVTIDYSTVEANPYWSMNCRCGSKNCRGVVRSIVYLPTKNFKRYYPFIPTKLKQYYLKRKGKILSKI
jgi:hypothetical protein